jgi:DNA-binding CsgD family transcriptional regulator
MWRNGGNICGHKWRKLGDNGDGDNLAKPAVFLLQYAKGVRLLINARIAEFASHLANYELTEDEICEFLTTSTLNFLGVKHVWLSNVTNRQTVRARASYGVNQDRFADWQEFPLDWKLPVTDALTEKRLVWINSLPEWPPEYPLLKGVEYSEELRTQIVVPIFRLESCVGCLGILSEKNLNPDQEIDLFLQTLSHLISLHVYRKERERAKKGSPNVTSLTDRQVEILMHISEKKTNIEIADIMGYSESTIRQETIRIFEKLHLSGRNEARRYFLENKERFGISARSKGEVPSSREEFAH